MQQPREAREDRGRLLGRLLEAVERGLAEQRAAREGGRVEGLWAAHIPAHAPNFALRGLQELLEYS